MIDGEFEEVHDPTPPKQTPDTKMPTNPATPELASLLPEGSNFQAAEAPIIATTSTEAPLSSKSPESETAEMPPFPQESLPTERPVTAAASTEVPRSPEASTQP